MMVPRLHIEGGLQAGEGIELAAERAHYLAHVLRLRPGALLQVFNAEAGEWEAELTEVKRHAATASVRRQLRSPAPEPGPTLLFAPIKRNRLDWLVEKAVELGAARLVPVITERTVVRLDNPARLSAIMVEAAEQCGRLSVPVLEPVQPLAAWLDRAEGPLLMADESGGGRPLVQALGELPDAALLIGPEGGFNPQERAALLTRPEVVPVSLGPRILRAETAALYVLSAWQAVREARGGKSAA